MTGSAEVDAYIAGFPEDVQEILDRMREIVREVAPDAEERIAYGMPGYKLNGKPLVYFAGYAKHIGFYATPNGHEAFKEDFARYKQGKGSVQFPLDEPMPYELVERVVRFRVDDVSNKSSS